MYVGGKPVKDSAIALVYGLTVGRLGVTALKREKTKSIETTGMTQDRVLLKQDTAPQIVSLVTTVPPFSFLVPV